MRFFCPLAIYQIILVIYTKFHLISFNCGYFTIKRTHSLGSVSIIWFIANEKHSFINFFISSLFVVIVDFLKRFTRIRSAKFIVIREKLTSKQVAKTSSNIFTQFMVIKTLREAKIMLSQLIQSCFASE